MNILLIDDEPIFLETLARRLQRQGHGIVSETNGKKGYDAFCLKPEAFDLILTDIKMPEMNGIELIKRLRHEEYDVPVILMTGYGDLEMSVEALRIGAFDFLVKPLEFTSLFQSLTKLESLKSFDRKILTILPRVSGQIHIEIPSKLSYIENTVAYFQHIYHPYWKMYRMDNYRLGLCLHEALTNAIIHGNLEISSAIKEESMEHFEERVKERESDPSYSTRKVKVSINFDVKHLDIEIEDEGPGFDFNSKLQNIPATPLFSGRGLLIMRSFMDVVEWKDRGNFLFMRKNFN